MCRQAVQNLYLAQQHPVGQGLFIHDVSRSHTTAHHSRYDTSGRGISSSQRHLPYNIQHSQQTPVSAGEQPQAYTLDRAATGTGVEQLATDNMKIYNVIIHIILYITYNNYQYMN